MAPSLLAFSAKFDSTAVYATKDPHNQADINKLMGFSDCAALHQVNSARFGWRWYDEQLQIWAYTYVNGARNSKYVGNVQPGTYHSYSISLEHKAYVFRLENQEVTMDRSCSGAGNGYWLYPYFGGDEPAPHHINVWIREQAQHAAALP